MWTKEQTEQGIADLRALLVKGETVWVVLRHQSDSGMTRWVDLFVIRNGVPRMITHLSAKAIGWAFTERHHALKVEGCGMDMGFHAVSTLSYRLYGEDGALSHRWL